MARDRSEHHLCCRTARPQRALSNLVGDGNYDPVEEANGPRAIFSFSAVFAEVRVDPDFGLVRLNRFVEAWRPL